MKGIVLAAGLGRNLHPLTLVTNKQLLTVYDKPMIYYPLHTLILAGIKDILLISTPHHVSMFKKLLGDGSKFKIHLSYEIQKKAIGPADAFAKGKKFIGKDACALIFGDNIFYGAGLVNKLKQAVKNATVDKKMTLFCYPVKNPKRFGIVQLDKHNNPINIEEKPKKPKSNLCVTGLYFYPSGVTSKLSKIKLSERNEYEITSLNNMYVANKQAKVIMLNKGYKWFDAGSFESLLKASDFVSKTKKRTRN